MTHQNLWAPWRIDYIRQIEANPPESSRGSACFLCDAAGVVNDEREMQHRLMLLNDHRGMILLNRFPYTNGHLLVAPRDHVGDLTDLTAEQRHGIMDLIVLAERVLQRALNPQGMNVGMNLGRCAGAGLPGHVHVHVLPRWNGDTNFMQTVGQVRVIPEALETSYANLRATLQQLDG